jgi:hypothetical protein
MMQPFEGEDNDTELIDRLPYLRELAVAEDVRVHLKAVYDGEALLEDYTRQRSEGKYTAFRRPAFQRRQ